MQGRAELHLPVPTVAESARLLPRGFANGDAAIGLPRESVVA